MNSEGRPNIILFVAEGHNADVMGVYGNTIVETPALDRLARSGRSLSHCYAASPLCVPARLSMLTERYVSDIGVWNNFFTLPSNDVPTLPRVLSDLGYDCYLAGRMHLEKDRDYGFTKLLPEYEDHTDIKTCEGVRRHPRDLNPLPDRWRRFRRRFAPSRQAGERNRDLEITEAAQAFLRERQQAREDDNSRPCFLVVGFDGPASPFRPHPDVYEKYLDRVEPPRAPPPEFSSLTTNYQQIARGDGFEFATPKEMKKGRAAYYASVEELDAHVGSILDLARLDETAVLYTSDHGEGLGEHGFWKKSTMFDSSVRVPLIVALPGLSGSWLPESRVCSALDISATIRQVAGDSAGLPGARGRSLLQKTAEAGAALSPIIRARSTYGGGSER